MGYTTLIELPWLLSGISSLKHLQMEVFLVGLLENTFAAVSLEFFLPLRSVITVFLVGLFEDFFALVCSDFFLLR